MEIAKWIVAFVALFNFGGLAFDALIPRTAAQHLWNSKWSPHAKFHNSQTMLLGMFNGTLSLTLLFGTHPLTLPLFTLAAVIAANYFVAMVFAPFFPGTAWTDPDFSDQMRGPFGLAVQQFMAYLLCLLILAAFALVLLIG